MQYTKEILQPRYDSPKLQSTNDSAHQRCQSIAYQKCIYIAPKMQHNKDAPKHQRVSHRCIAAKHPHVMCLLTIFEVPRVKAGARTSLASVGWSHCWSWNRHVHTLTIHKNLFFLHNSLFSLLLRPFEHLEIVPIFNLAICLSSGFYPKPKKWMAQWGVLITQQKESFLKEWYADSKYWNFLFQPASSWTWEGGESMFTIA